MTKKNGNNIFFKEVGDIDKEGKKQADEMFREVLGNPNLKEAFENVKKYKEIILVMTNSALQFYYEEIKGNEKNHMTRFLEAIISMAYLEGRRDQKKEDNE